MKALPARARLLFLPLAFLAVFLAYGRSLDGGFVFDDHHFVENNPAIKSLHNTFRFFYDISTLSDMPGLNSKGYRPLAVLSYTVDHALAGLNPGYFRAINLLLHCLNVLLVFYLGRLLGFEWIYAGLMSAFFAFFPANVESVVWITSRSTVLSTALILGAVICFIKRVRTENARYLPPAALFTAAALFTREISVVVPLLALAFLAAGRGPVKKYLGEIALYLALPVLLFMLLRGSLLGGLAQAPQFKLPLPACISLPVLLFAKYLDVLLWPFSMLITYSDLILLRLARFWFYFILSDSIFLLYAVLAALLRARGRKTAALGLLWLWIAFLPVLNIVPMTFFMAERLTYLPLIGLSMTVAAAARYLNGKYRSPALVWTACGALLILFVLNIQARLPVWKSDIALWSYDAEKNPGNFLTRLRLAEVLRDAGDLSGSYSALDRALALATNTGERAVVSNEIGVLYATRNDFKKAERFFRDSIALNSENYLAFYNLGKVCALERDIKAARSYVSRSLELNPAYAPARELAASLPSAPSPAKPSAAHAKK